MIDKMGKPSIAALLKRPTASYGYRLTNGSHDNSIVDNTFG